MYPIKLKSKAIAAAIANADAYNCVITILRIPGHGWDLGMNYVDSSNAYANVLPLRYFSPEAPGIRQMAIESQIHPEVK